MIVEGRKTDPPKYCEEVKIHANKSRLLQPAFARGGLGVSGYRGFHDMSDGMGLSAIGACHVVL